MKILSKGDSVILLIESSSKFLNITLSDIDEDDKEVLRADLRVLLHIGTNLQEEYVECYINELKELVLRKCK
ncbi:Uncharacterised protein [Escherichia coli]|uniref:hypothetical protein n=1 Tax=Escherichia coli TaxID=562 RepID=UPI001A48E601|nr:hypothetical protein [Escherichia coli]VVZ31840.1 Uncharacterised protein [Escherichia coli]VVZ33560.1 Uncharacterised protein [Escherichia coli]VWN20558.1 Uncharacterised protein [Escherichia coli]HBB9485673.1 hypothetical protein [Escherichia coli]HBC8458179.1 hypothetical protein [Escherichia coli]